MAFLVVVWFALSFVVAQSTLNTPTPTATQTPAWLVFLGIGLAVGVGIAALVWIKRPVREVNRRRREESE